MAIANHLVLQFPSPQLPNKSLNKVNFPLNCPFEHRLADDTLVWSFLSPVHPIPFKLGCLLPVSTSSALAPHHYQSNLLKIKHPCKPVPPRALLISGFQGSKWPNASLPFRPHLNATALLHLDLLFPDWIGLVHCPLGWNYSPLLS